MNPVATWFLVLIMTAFADVAWTRYFIETEHRHAVKASFWSAMIVALGSFTTFQFVHNPWMATAAIIGGFAGTYVTIKFAKKK